MQNHRASRIREKTPTQNVTPNILSQNSKTRRYTGLPVTRWNVSSTVSHAASPIVNEGKMMWNDTVKANCSRDNKSAVHIMSLFPFMDSGQRKRLTFARSTSWLGLPSGTAFACFPRSAGILSKRAAIDLIGVRRAGLFLRVQAAFR